MKVDVAAVEAELARMQRELTSSEVRTSLFNLVVMSPDAQQAMVDEALNYLLGKRAARVIHVVSRPDASSSLEVSARCFVDHEHKGVCFQEIILTNGGDEAGGAPGSWIPLLVRDIPSYVLWLTTVTGSGRLFSDAQNQADKVIVDSDHCVELGDDPVSLLARLRTTAVREGVPLADFSWKRLRPYRRLAAATFSGSGREEWLSEISGVRVTGLRPMAGILFGLWLAERLGWTTDATDPPSASYPGGPAATSTAGGGVPDAHGTIMRRYRDVRGREIPVSVDPGERGCDVTMAFELADGRTVDVVAGRNGCADVEYPDGVAHHVVSIPSNGEILLEEVDAVYADDYYRAALERLPG